MILTKLLVAALILGLFPKTSQPQKTEFTYVSLGASQTTGYGLHGFVPKGFYDDPAKIYQEGKGERDGYYSSGYYFYSNKAYPVLIKEKLEEKYGENNVHLYQSAINSMRAYDLAYLLDENVEADAYTYWRLDSEKHDVGWIYDLERERNDTLNLGGQDVNFAKEETNLREEFKTNIANADLITYDLGINDLTVYVARRLLESKFDNDLSKTIGEEYAGYYYQAKEMIYETLFSEISEPLKNLATSFIDNIIDTLAYSVTGLIYGFETAMVKIYELNPDVEVVVVGIQNILKGIKLKISEFEIDAGTIFGVVTGLANFYMSHLSKYSDKFYFADFGEKQRATAFRDEIVDWNGELATLPINVIDAFDVYENNFLAANIVKETLAQKADGLKSEYTLNDSDIEVITEKAVDYMHIVLGTTAKLALTDLTIDILNCDLEAIEGIENFFEENDAFLAILEEYLTEKKFENTYANAINALTEMFNDPEKPGFKGGVGAVLILEYANSFFSHPNEEGHEEIAGVIWKAFTEKKIARYDFVYAAIEISVALAKIALQKAREMTLEAIAALDNLGSVTLVKIAEIKAKIEATRAYVLEKQAEAKASMEASFEEAFDIAYGTLLEELDEAMEKANSLSATVKENIHTSFDNLWSYLLGILNR